MPGCPTPTAEELARLRAMLAHRPRVDWFRVFVDLDRAGYSMPKVASTLGISVWTLRSNRNDGCEPKYDRGRAIVALWCQATQRPERELPALEGAPLSAAGVERINRQRGAAPRDVLAKAVETAGRDLNDAMKGWAVRDPTPA